MLSKLELVKGYNPRVEHASESWTSTKRTRDDQESIDHSRLIVAARGQPSLLSAAEACLRHTSLSLALSSQPLARITEGENATWKPPNLLMKSEFHRQTP